MAGMRYIHLIGATEQRTVCGLDAADQQVDSIGTCPWCRRGDTFPLRTRSTA